MSDFLSNLIGRSAGSLEVVRPRVPSIYEPDRPVGTFPGTLQRPLAVDVPPELEVQSEGDAAIERPRVRPGLRMPQGDVDTPASPAQVRDEFHVPDARPEVADSTVLRVTAGEHKAFPDASTPEQVMASEAGEAPEDTLIVRPSSVPRLNIASEILPPQSTPSPETVGASDSGAALIHRSTRVPAQPLTARPPLKPWLRPLARKEEISISRAEPDQPAAALQPPMEEPVFHPPVEPLVSKSPAVPPAAVPTNRGTPEPATPLTPSEPSIRVSIGRVEVRAVFPEPAERRAPAPKARPTVSLDDYLNRQNRSRS